MFLYSFSASIKEALTKELTNALIKPLLEYVPRSRNGSIIIISRSKEEALKIVAHKDLIKVKPIEKPKALELLKRKLK